MREWGGGIGMEMDGLIEGEEEREKGRKERRDGREDGKGREEGGKEREERGWGREGVKKLAGRREKRKREWVWKKKEMNVREMKYMRMFVCIFVFSYFCIYEK